MITEGASCLGVKKAPALNLHVVLKITVCLKRALHFHLPQSIVIAGLRERLCPFDAAASLCLNSTQKSCLAR